MKKFITIGRFSKEKGHIRLVNSFNRFCKENKSNNNYLIIVGGHGNEYERLLKYVGSLEYSANIIIVKYLFRPC